MGNIQSKFKNQLSIFFSMFHGYNKASLAILGLDGVGKTTLVNLFRHNDNNTQPTLGFNVEEVVICNTTIKVWDMGGQKEFISYWKDYIYGINGLVYILDIADNDRFNVALEAFETIIPYLSDNLPVLILCNKKDVINNHEELDKRMKIVESLFKIKEDEKGCGKFINMSDKKFISRVNLVSVLDDITNLFKQKPLDGLSKPSTWAIQDSSVYPGFKWLLDKIKNKDY